MMVVEKDSNGVMSTIRKMECEGDTQIVETTGIIKWRVYIYN